MRKRVCLEQRLPKNPLTLGGNESEASEYSSDDNDNSNQVDAFNGKTSLERYVENTELQIKSKSDLIASLKEKECSIQKKIERVRSNPSDGNICRCCHMRLGHTSQSCTFGKCTSVFKCGEEKFQAGKSNLKELQASIKKHESELTKLQVELQNKRAAIATNKDHISNRIENELFQTRKEDYCINSNKNWTLLRKHVYLVEKYCKDHMGGKIPAKQDVSELLSRALEENNSTTPTEYQRARQSSRRKHENPFKHNLERHGVQFPSPVPTWQNQECTSSSEISKPSALRSEVSPIMFTAPSNLNEEKEQLAMVTRTECPAMQHSKKHHVHRNINYYFYPAECS